MADFYAVTSSDPITLDKDQIDAVDALYNNYYIPNLEYGPFEGDNSFGFWMYDTFQVLDNDEDYNDVTDEFLEELSKILKEGQVLKICSAGHEKLRYTAATQITVKKDKVEYTSIGAG